MPLDEGDERADILVVEPGARVVFLKLLDKPLRVVNANAEASVCRTEKCPGERAEFAGLRPREQFKLPAPAAVDETFFEVDPDAGVCSLEEGLDLGEERAHVAMIGTAGASM